MMIQWLQNHYEVTGVKLLIMISWLQNWVIIHGYKKVLLWQLGYRIDYYDVATKLIITILQVQSNYCYTTGTGLIKMIPHL